MKHGTHPMNATLSVSLDRTLDAHSRGSALENNEHRRAGQQARDQLKEEVESIPSLPEDELPRLPPREPPQKKKDLRGESSCDEQASIGGADNIQAFPLAVAPPRSSPFAAHILAEAIQPGIMIPNISEYDGTEDPQDHLDRFLAKADSFQQLSLRFLHQFSINKRYPKMASYLFTVIQQEHKNLRDYVQRFFEPMLEVPHINPELLASIMQQNMRRGRFCESIAGKPPTTLDELLVRAEKYIRIEEASDVRTITPTKRKAEEDGGHSRQHVSDDNQKERRHVPPPDITQYTPLKAPRAEILAVAEQQGIVRQPLRMRKIPRG
ncbi:UNVERIFIED_CONTAM: hypothetical protein Sradi_0693100 [Sesamum radiatum]|uniref:Retrotransposon gag domain-containing protein n=1 Tax=Sesamum radiatum TaxID=300843 RepID=A0AAW2VNH8_SESRA